MDRNVKPMAPPSNRHLKYLSKIRQIWEGEGGGRQPPREKKSASHLIRTIIRRQTISAPNCPRPAGGAHSFWPRHRASLSEFS